MPAAASASASSPPRPNTNGSPPLRRTTCCPRAGGANHQPVDELLPDLRAARALADEHALRRRGQRERRRIDQRVVEHEIGVGEAVGRLPRQQVGVAWPGADERDEAASGKWSCVCKRCHRCPCVLPVAVRGRRSRSVSTAR